jgi:hypothetical protein
MQGDFEAISEAEKMYEQNDCEATAKLQRSNFKVTAKPIQSAVEAMANR